MTPRLGGPTGSLDLMAAVPFGLATAWVGIIAGFLWFVSVGFELAVTVVGGVWTAVFGLALALTSFLAEISREGD